MNLVKFLNTDSKSIATTLANYEFPSTIEGLHQIDISRNLDGEFKIYFDSELKIQTIDNQHKTSQKFGITSWKGNSSFDNIEVRDSTIDEETTETVTSTTSTLSTSEEEDSPLIAWLLFPSLIVVSLIKKTRKRGN